MIVLSEYGYYLSWVGLPIVSISWRRDVDPIFHRCWRYTSTEPPPLSSAMKWRPWRFRLPDINISRDITSYFLIGCGRTSVAQLIPFTETIHAHAFYIALDAVYICWITFDYLYYGFNNIMINYSKIRNCSYLLVKPMRQVIILSCNTCVWWIQLIDIWENG